MIASWLGQAASCASLDYKRVNENVFPGVTAVFPSSRTIHPVDRPQSIVPSTFSVFGKLIGYLQPTYLAARPCVIFRRHLLWVVKAARRNVNLIREILILESQWRAAIVTEAAGCHQTRLETSRLSREKSKLSARHAEPCDERGTGGSPADRAMTVGLMKGRCRCFITDPPAKASAFQHFSSLLEGRVVITILNYSLILPGQSSACFKAGGARKNRAFPFPLAVLLF